MRQIPETHQKLHEAFLFYQDLSRLANEIVTDPKVFVSYLSAFLSASRTVVDHFVKGQGPWYSNWTKNIDSEEYDLLDFMRKHRNAQVHRTKKGAMVDVEVEMVPLIETVRGGFGNRSRIQSWGPPGSDPPKVGRNVFYLRLGNRKELATDVCQRYLDVLNKLVSDFDASHP